MASIFLAVGHGVSTDGTWDCGCTNGKYTEADLMLAIGKKATALLRQSGITVVTDADTSNNRNMTYTVRDANASGVDIYVSLHCDWVQAPTGTLPIVYPGSSNGMKLASALDSAYRKVTGLGTRGILQRDDFEVTNTDMPACIFETGSINSDLSILLKADVCAKGIAQGVCNYFGKTLKGVSPTQQPAKITTTTKTTAKTATANTTVKKNNIVALGQQHSINFTGRKITVDGVWGSDTQKNAMMCVQVACNHDYNSGLAQDGIWGSASTAALSGHYVENGETQYLVTAVEILLMLRGYDPKGVECPGEFGNGCEAAVRAFQKAKGLEVDGIAGVKTINALMGVGSGE